MIWLGIAVAGAIGSALRLLLFETGRRRIGHDSPWTAWVLNCSGCFFLGLVIGLLLAQEMNANAAAILGTGLIGAYSVVSPLTYDALVIGLQGSWGKAALHSFGAMLACIGSATVGLAITGAL